MVKKWLKMAKKISDILTTWFLNALLDDPLSAVDPGVAKHIFDQFILGKLIKNGHTVILVTHGMQFLQKCDKIAFMKNGSITEFGTHQQLMEDGKDFVSMNSYDQSKKMDKVQGSEAGKNEFIRQRTVSISSEKMQKIVKEEPDQMNAAWSVLLKYFEACGGYLVMFGIVLLVLVFVLIRLFSSIWLQIWLDQGDGNVQERKENSTLNNQTLTDVELRGNIADNPDLQIYQMVHGLSLVALVFVGLCKGFGMATCLLRGSSRMHERMLKRVMKCPMAFFDSTPSGQVMNRFSKDMDESK